MLYVFIALFVIICIITHCISSILEYFSSFEESSNFPNKSIHIWYKKEKLWFKEPPADNFLQNQWYIKASYSFSSNYKHEDEFCRLKIRINNLDNSERNYYFNLKFYFENFSKSIALCVMSRDSSDTYLMYDCKIFKGQIENICFKEDLVIRLFDNRDVSADYMELSTSETNRLQHYLKQLYIKGTHKKEKLIKYLNQ